MTKDNFNLISILVILILLSFFLGGIIGTLEPMWDNQISLSQETGNDVCLHLTGNQSIASELNGKLICETPSYDSTTNIIVRTNGEKTT